jgi:hypothetical protein
MDGFTAMMRLSRTSPGWIPVIRACLDSPSADFAAKWVHDRVELWPGPSFKPLVAAGVLEKVAEGDRALHYRFIDRSRVELAMQVLGA